MILSSLIKSLRLKLKFKKKKKKNLDTGIESNTNTLDIFRVLRDSSQEAWAISGGQCVISLIRYKNLQTADVTWPISTTGLSHFNLVSALLIHPVILHFILLVLNVFENKRL